MSFQTSANTYRWSRFEECNTDTTTAFENMCRILFKKKFVDENTLLVSAPNNPGIEVEPVLEKNTGERISFQAKYFSTATPHNYPMIIRNESTFSKCIYQP